MTAKKGIHSDEFDDYMHEVEYLQYLQKRAFLSSRDAMAREDWRTAANYMKQEKQTMELLIKAFDKIISIDGLDDKSRKMAIDSKNAYIEGIKDIEENLEEYEKIKKRIQD